MLQCLGIFFKTHNDEEVQGKTPHPWASLLCSEMICQQKHCSSSLCLPHGGVAVTATTLHTLSSHSG